MLIIICLQFLSFSIVCYTYKFPVETYIKQNQKITLKNSLTFNRYFLRYVLLFLLCNTKGNLLILIFMTTQKTQIILNYQVRYLQKKKKIFRVFTHYNLNYIYIIIFQEQENKRSCRKQQLSQLLLFVFTQFKIAIFILFLNLFKYQCSLDFFIIIFKHCM